MGPGISAISLGLVGHLGLAGWGLAAIGDSPRSAKGLFGTVCGIAAALSIVSLVAKPPLSLAPRR